MKILTIYTDATHISQRDVASCAWYIRTDNNRILGSKICPAEIKNINQAEMYAIAQALYIASRKWELEQFERIIINSDSATAIRWLKNEPSKKHDIYRRIYYAFKLTAGRSKIHLRKVKAHSGGKTKQSWVNELVDKHSRKTARDHVKKQLQNKK